MEVIFCLSALSPTLVHQPDTGDSLATLCSPQCPLITASIVTPHWGQTSSASPTFLYFYSTFAEKLVVLACSASVELYWVVECIEQIHTAQNTNCHPIFSPALSPLFVVPPPSSPILPTVISDLHSITTALSVTNIKKNIENTKISPYLNARIFSPEMCIAL